MIGLATIGGGLILGLSAGLMAPVIAGGLGALLTTVGVGGTGFLGSTAGIALITGGATLAGGSKLLYFASCALCNADHLSVLRYL